MSSPASSRTLPSMALTCSMVRPPAQHHHGFRLGWRQAGGFKTITVNAQDSPLRPTTLSPLWTSTTTTVDTAATLSRRSLNAPRLFRRARRCQEPDRRAVEVPGRSQRVDDEQRQHPGRCGHERGVDPPAGSADPAAARRAVALDRQPEQPDDPEALRLMS